MGFGYVFTRNLCDVYLLSPPKIKQTPNASKFAKERLAELGAMKRTEKIMLGVFLLLLALWAGALGLFFGISFNATTVALLGLSLVLVSGVLSFDDVLKEKTAWNTLVWFSALVMMATMLGKLGVTQFLAEALGGLALGAPPLLYAFIMITSSNIMMAYATRTAPVIFGTNYVTLKRWRRVGFVIFVVDMLVMISVGLVWWKFLGFY